MQTKEDKKKQSPSAYISTHFCVTVGELENHNLTPRQQAVFPLLTKTTASHRGEKCAFGRGERAHWQLMPIASIR